MSPPVLNDTANTWWSTFTLVSRHVVALVRQYTPTTWFDFDNPSTALLKARKKAGINKDRPVKGVSDAEWVAVQVLFS